MDVAPRCPSDQAPFDDGGQRGPQRALSTNSMPVAGSCSPLLSDLCVPCSERCCFALGLRQRSGRTPRDSRRWPPFDSSIRLTMHRDSSAGVNSVGSRLSPALESQPSSLNPAIGVKMAQSALAAWMVLVSPLAQESVVPLPPHAPLPRGCWSQTGQSASIREIRVIREYRPLTRHSAIAD